MNILVTGGAGFIGANLVSMLAENKHTIAILDNLSTEASLTRAAMLKRTYDVPTDTRDIKDISDVLREYIRIDAITHLASPISVQESIKNPHEYRKDINEGTLHVLEAAKQRNIRRVVLASTAAVYGNPNVVPIREGHPVDPLTPYATEKYAAECHARMFAREHGLETVILRLFNVYGPGQDARSPYSGVIAKFMQCFLNDKPPIIYGDGEQTRDFIYVSDVVDAFHCALTKQVEPGLTVNIGEGKACSINLLVKMIEGCRAQVIKPIYQEARPGDILHSEADIKRAHKHLGWRPHTPQGEGMLKTWEWYAKQSY